MNKAPMTFGAEASQRVDRIYQNPDIVAQRQFTLDHLKLKKGDHVIDIGCGPGLLAMDMAEIVGPTGRVIGVDPSEDMCAIAADRCKDVGSITIKDGDANTLPCETSSLDAAIATQVYEFVPEIDAALTEAYRALKPGGQLAIIDTDWDSVVMRTDDRDRMHKVLEGRRDHFVHPDLPGRLPSLLSKAGFDLAYSGGTPIVNTSMAQGTYSAEIIRSSAKQAAKREGLSPEIAEAWLKELEGFEARGEFFFSITRFLFIAQKPS